MSAMLVDDVVARVRAEFDGGFAVVPNAREVLEERFLALKAGGSALLLRVSDVASLETQRKIVSLPGTRPELLGIAGVRGRLVCVFSLARLLGHAAGEDPRWIAVLSDDGGVGFAFETFDGYSQARSRDIHRASASEKDNRHIPELLREPSKVRGIIKVGSLLGEIRSHTSPSLVEEP